MDAPLTLDVLIPHHNNAAGLQISFASVAAQTWAGDLRVVVVDDGSDPVEFGEVERIAGAQPFPVVLRREAQNLGRPRVRNRLLAEVQAAYAAWLDAGELWYPEKLDRQMQHLAALEQNGVDVNRLWVTCHYELARHDTVTFQRQDVGGDQLAELLFGDQLRAYLWTLVGRAGAFRAAGLFDEELARLQDLDYAIRFLRAGGRFTLPPGDGPLCRYDKSDLGRHHAVVAASSRHIMNKHRSVYAGYGATSLRRARWNFEMLTARFAWNNGERLAAAKHFGIGVAASPSHTVRRVRRKLASRSSMPPVSATTPSGDGERAALDAPMTMTSEAKPERVADPAAPLNGKRVMLVCEKLADRSGGAERVLIELANALCRRGYQVDVVSHELFDDPPFYPLEFGVVHTNLSPASGVRRVRDKGVQGVHAGLHKPRRIPFPLDRLAWTARYASFRSRLKRHVEAAAPDVVVAFMPPAFVATALADPTARPRLVASTHNAPEQDFENPDRWDPGAYARRRRIELLSHMDAITVLLPDYQQWYPRALRNKTVVVPNAVVPVPPDVLSAAVREPTILAVGRLADTKRHDLSLRAFARLAEDFPEWQLKIFGVGPLEQDLKRLCRELGISDRAHVMGHTADIATEYLSASILSHPARFEGFPLAVTESLASGLPVVGFTDCSGVNGLVHHEENGLLVDPSDGSDEGRRDGLVNALRLLMSDECERARLGANGPESMAPFRPDAVVDTWEKVLFP